MNHEYIETNSGQIAFLDNFTFSKDFEKMIKRFFAFFLIGVAVLSTLESIMSNVIKYLQYIKCHWLSEGFH